MLPFFFYLSPLEMPPPKGEPPKLTKEEKRALAEAEAAAKAAEEARLAAELAARLAAERAARQVAWGQERAAEVQKFQGLTAAAVERASKLCTSLQHTHLGMSLLLLPPSQPS